MIARSASDGPRPGTQPNGRVMSIVIRARPCSREFLGARRRGRCVDKRKMALGFLREPADRAARPRVAAIRFPPEQEDRKTLGRLDVVGLLLMASGAAVHVRGR